MQQTLKPHTPSEFVTIEGRKSVPLKIPGRDFRSGDGQNDPEQVRCVTSKIYVGILGRVVG